MSDILAKTSQQQDARMNNIKSTRPNSVETSGSLAMNKPASLFATPVYDMFSSSNPFSVDYSQYADCGDTVASNSSFLGGFSSAYSTLSASTGSDSSSTCSAGGSDGGFSGGASVSSCGSSGGFSSMC